MSRRRRNHLDHFSWLRDERAAELAIRKQQRFNPAGTEMMMGIGPATAFSISSLPNLALWNKADSGLFQNTAGTTPCTTNAQAVQFITDYSGAGRNASGNAAPGTYVLPAQNGLPAVQPVGGSFNYGLASSIVAGGPMTIYAIADCLSPATLTTGVIGNNGGSGSAGLVLLVSTVFFINDAGASGSAAYTGGTGYVLFRCRRDVSNNCFFTASGMAEVALGAVSGNFTFDALFGRALSGQFSNNPMSELIVLNGTDLPTSSAVQDAATISYLKTKWAVTYP